jgi:protoporphyrinogen oxidase
VKNWKKLEKVLVADWLRRWSGRRTFEKIWLPLLRAKLGDNYKRTSAAFIWATIARMYAARRTGLKKEMFGYVPGGYARILEQFGKALSAEGVKIRLRHAVWKIEAVDANVSVEFENGEKWRSRCLRLLPRACARDLPRKKRQSSKMFSIRASSAPLSC